MNISYLLVYLSALSIIFDSLEAFILERVCIRAGTALSARRSRTTNSKRTQLPNLSEKGFPDDIADVYDLIVIGSGSGGEACAIESAKLGLNRVAVVEKKAMFGGPTGLTSKAVREATKRICAAVDEVGGDRRRQIKGIWRRRYPILKSEAEVLQYAESREKLKANAVDVFKGEASFLEPLTTDGDGDSDSDSESDDNNKDEQSQQKKEEDKMPPVRVRVCRGNRCIELLGKHAVVATGSRPNRPTHLPVTKETEGADGHAPITLDFDDPQRRILDATEFSSLVELPSSVAIIGGGVIAVEYATVLAELKVGVTLFCREGALLPFLDQDVRDALLKGMRRNHILIVNDAIQEIQMVDAGVIDGQPGEVGAGKVRVVLQVQEEELFRRPQRKFLVDKVLYSGGRDANSQGLALDRVGVRTGRYGRIEVDAMCRTTAPQSIFAIGDVIGPPGLASAAQQMGRRVARSLFASPEDNGSNGALRSAPMAASPLYTAEECFVEQDPFFQSAGWDREEEQEGAGTDESSGNLVGSVSAADTLFGSADGTASSSSSLSLSTLLTKMPRDDTPVTLWTIPEVASVGITNTASCEPVAAVAGIARFRDCARGRLSGQDDGFMKVVCRADTGVILGCCIYGEGANELIQVASILVHMGVTVQTVSRTPFAAVTLSGLYQMACDDAIAKMRNQVD